MTAPDADDAMLRALVQLVESQNERLEGMRQTVVDLQRRLQARSDVEVLLGHELRAPIDLVRGVLAARWPPRGPGSSPSSSPGARARPASAVAAAWRAGWWPRSPGRGAAPRPPRSTSCACWPARWAATPRSRDSSAAPPGSASTC